MNERYAKSYNQTKTFCCRCCQCGKFVDSNSFFRSLFGYHVCVRDANVKNEKQIIRIWRLFFPLRATLPFPFFGHFHSKIDSVNPSYQLKWTSLNSLVAECLCFICDAAVFKEKKCALVKTNTERKRKSENWIEVKKQNSSKINEIILCEWFAWIYIVFHRNDFSAFEFHNVIIKLFIWR